MVCDLLWNPVGQVGNDYAHHGGVDRQLLRLVQKSGTGHGIFDEGGAVKDRPQLLAINQSLVPLQKKLTHPFFQCFVFIGLDKFITPQPEIDPCFKIFHSCQNFMTYFKGFNVEKGHDAAALPAFEGLFIELRIPRIRPVQCQRRWPGQISEIINQHAFVIGNETDGNFADFRLFIQRGDEGQ